MQAGNLEQEILILNEVSSDTHLCTVVLAVFDCMRLGVLTDHTLGNAISSA